MMSGWKKKALSFCIYINILFFLWLNILTGIQTLRPHRNAFRAKVFPVWLARYKTQIPKELLFTIGYFFIYFYLQIGMFSSDILFLLRRFVSNTSNIINDLI